MREIQSLEQSRAEQPSCRVIGQMDNSIDHTFESANRVYDDMGIAPTVNTCGGGGLQPKVLEVKKLSECIGGFGEKKSNNGTQYFQQDRVYSMGDVALTHPANLPGGSYNYLEVKKMEDLKVLGNYMPSEHDASRVVDTDGICPAVKENHGTVTGVVETKQIVAMRGRNPDDPSDRTAGIKTEQRLEPNNANYTNTLTSVQKDNLVLEADVVAIDEQNNCIRQETFGCLTTDGSSPKHNNRVGEIAKIKIRQATKDGFIECELPGVADLNYPSSETRRGRVQDGGQVSPTLTTENIHSVLELADPDFYNFLYEIDGEIYLIRIRKLIPLECWRLMDFNEGSFEKAQEVNSNTQLYKQAGNSIVVNCLVAIFGQMFEGKEDIYKQINLRK